MDQDLFNLCQLALDLKRSAVGSEKIRKIFLKEVKKKKMEIGKNEFPDYINKILDINFLNTDKENLLMYSVILQNYGRTN